MTLHTAQIPWALLAIAVPLLGGLGGLAMPGRRPLWSASALAGLWLVVLRIVLGFDFRLDGLQFASSLPAPGLGVDGWSAAGLLCVSLSATAAARLRWERPAGLPPLLLATGAGIAALLLGDPTLSLVAAVGGILALQGLRARTIVLAGAALAGILAAEQPLLAAPLVLLGFGGLAVTHPRDDAGGMVLRAGVLAPALLLAVPRLVMPMAADGVLVWSQAAAPLAAAVAVWGALRALGARDLAGITSGVLTTQAAAILTVWLAVRLDAWNGGVLLALWMGPVAGLLCTLGDGSARWARLRGQPRRAMLAGLAGLTLAGAPLTPGFPALLLVGLGCWDSQWRHAPWWLVSIAVALFLAAFAPVRAAAAMRRGDDTGATVPRVGLLLAAATLAVGISPRLLLDLTDHGSAAQIQAMSAPLERLVTGQLRPLLPPALQGWWL